MAPPKEFERANAQQWDTESNFSVASSARPQVAVKNPRKGIGQGQGLPPASNSTFNPSTTRYPHPPQAITPHRQQGFGRSRGRSTSQLSTFPSAVRGTPPQTQVTPPQRQGFLNIRKLTSGVPTPRGPPQGNSAFNGNLPSHGHPQRPGLGYNPSNERQRPTAVSPGKVSDRTTIWARPQGLVTTRMGLLNSEEELKKSELQNYRSRPDTNEEFPVTAYYLWPKGYGDPMTMFDPTLKTFDLFRDAYKVHIDWNDKMHCLRINGKGRDAQKNITATIECIKRLYFDAKAQALSSSPLYIIVPPSADAMRKFVRPKIMEENEETLVPLVTRIELAGRRLFEAEKVEWESTSRAMIEENNKIFREHVIKRLSKLADLRGWMRMRIQFGHIKLGQYQREFSLGRYTWEGFVNMMQKSRVTTGGTFDRKMDASIAMTLIHRIVGRSQDFCPKNSNYVFLFEVQLKPKFTEIIFITSPGGRRLRVETDIEVVYKHEPESTRAIRNYQLGTTRMFEDSHRNKRVEVTTVDVERQFDWTLEVITDGEIKEIPGALQSYISPSLTVRSRERTDSLGLPYPAIAFGTPSGFVVQNVVLRSVFQYMWIKSDNVVEIAMYREWNGYDTTPEPTMQASVSMFNTTWDSEMESIENTTLERKWDRNLHKIFGEDGVGRNGIKGLMVEVAEIQRLLSEAATVALTAEDAELKEYEATDHALIL